MVCSEDHLHMIPYIQSAESWIRLGKGYKMVSIEFIGFHWHRVERKGLVNNKIYRERKKDYQPRIDDMLWHHIFAATIKGKPALLQLKSRGVRSWILRPWNSNGLAQYMAGTEVLVLSIQSTSHLILQSQRKEFPRRSLSHIEWKKIIREIICHKHWKINLPTLCFSEGQVCCSHSL